MVDVLPIRKSLPNHRDLPMKDYEFVSLKVKAETHRKVRVAAALADMGINEWIDQMVDKALSKTVHENAISLQVTSIGNLPEATPDAQPGI